MTCRASGTATAGQYANVGSVTAVDPFGTRVDDSDPSHYYGAAPGIEIVKQTNGVDADDPAGTGRPRRRPGDLDVHRHATPATPCSPASW